jgi:hydroxymethylglutaryl-CoA synthase
VVGDYEKFRKHIYHTPFPGMALLAHRTLSKYRGISSEEEIAASFAAKVEPGLHFSRKVGSSYGGSNFIGFLGLLAHARDLKPGDGISFFSYGGGSQAEFYGAVLGEGAFRAVDCPGIERHVEERMRLTVEEYEDMENRRRSYLGLSGFVPDRSAPAGAYRNMYEGQKLLVLEQVEDYKRRYAWS